MITAAHFSQMLPLKRNLPPLRDISCCMQPKKIKFATAQSKFEYICNIIPTFPKDDQYMCDLGSNLVTVYG